MLAHPHDEELDAGARKIAPGAQRLCLATGAVKPVDEMIRFVVGPDGAPVPDLRRRLPGRGVWVSATRAALETAVARKAFARGFKRDIRVAGDFVQATERLIERAALDALAIAHKAGRVAIGFGKADSAIAHERVAALIHAADAAPDGVRKLASAMRRQAGERAENVTVVDGFTTAQLDLALGRSNVVHAALLAGPESDSFLARAARLDRFRAGGPDALPARKTPGP
jgi:predicted RNA-binding protein YlxR (DUF448 family)